MERSLEQVRLLRDLQPATQMVIAMALDYVDVNHSYSGNARTDAAAELYKPYHNGRHTRNVLTDTLKVCDVLGITGFGREVAAVTAAHHDTVHELDASDDQNEQDSVALMHQNMRLFPEHFNGTAHEYSRLALLGTFVNKAGHILVQQATQQSYPSKLAERIAHAVAAADLGRMFSPDGPLIGHTYHQEKTTGASGIPPRIETVLAFQESQSLLLHGNYHYPNDELTQAFTTHRDQVCRYNEKLIKDLESERIENWNELLQRDRDFMRSQS